MRASSSVACGMSCQLLFMSTQKRATVVLFDQNAGDGLEAIEVGVGIEPELDADGGVVGAEAASLVGEDVGFDVGAVSDGGKGDAVAELAAEKFVDGDAVFLADEVE